MARCRRATVDEIRHAVEAESGNLTRAAARLGYTKRYFIQRVAETGIGAWAAELRVAAGGKARGRPPSNLTISA
jgi:hypothetical protein